ncbi:sulfotransferase domain-containing protein [Jannaschia sp. S6380]|uniref:sulfotransferase domain-containing protein n=1 Tax=Jannaschia sp. S6380 TaxID=2926408 RepID=UPI001FF59DC3|nr:sulfotransferase domain-containing protein [Jannaschia sp. S6380]MCK0168141.1 sulfotransferase domain-containing protein [Jannaschia sp. S6380]
MELIAPRIFCIGTHHKTGTLWMRAVFRQLADVIGVALYPAFARSGLHLVPDRDRAFLVSWSSAFQPALHDRPDARFLHLIRDPRDVLLSGMRYHLTTTRAEEAFLHEPRDDLDGRTYQQHLRALDGPEERLMFEMSGKHAGTLAEMLAWPYDRPNTIEARYETLIADTDGRTFREHLRDLGLTEPEVEEGARAFWRNALFGGLAKADDPARRGHVTDGAPSQWRRLLPRSVARAYAERHGDALVSLGYESHPTAWLKEIRDAA